MKDVSITLEQYLYMQIEMRKHFSTPENAKAAVDAQLLLNGVTGIFHQDPSDERCVHALIKEKKG